MKKLIVESMIVQYYSKSERHVFGNSALKNIQRLRAMLY